VHTANEVVPKHHRGSECVSACRHAIATPPRVGLLLSQEAPSKPPRFSDGLRVAFSLPYTQGLRSRPARTYPLADQECGTDTRGANQSAEPLLMRQPSSIVEAPVSRAATATMLAGLSLYHSGPVCWDGHWDQLNTKSSTESSPGAAGARAALWGSEASTAALPALENLAPTPCAAMAAATLSRMSCLETSASPPAISSAFADATTPAPSCSFDAQLSEFGVATGPAHSLDSGAAAIAGARRRSPGSASVPLAESSWRVSAAEQRGAHSESSPAAAATRAVGSSLDEEGRGRFLGRCRVGIPCGARKSISALKRVSSSEMSAREFGSGAIRVWPPSFTDAGCQPPSASTACGEKGRAAAGSRLHDPHRSLP